MKMRPEDYTQFRKSKPWGYYPPAVEEKIKQYEDTIRNLTDKCLEEQQARMSLEERIEKLQDELRDMHLQMSSLELPDASEAVEHFVLDDFKNYNRNNSDDIKEPEILNHTDEYNECSDSLTNDFMNLQQENEDDSDDLPFMIVK